MKRWSVFRVAVRRWFGLVSIGECVMRWGLGWSAGWSLWRCTIGAGFRFIWGCGTWSLAITLCHHRYRGLFTVKPFHRVYSWPIQYDLITPLIALIFSPHSLLQTHFIWVLLSFGTFSCAFKWSEISTGSQNCSRTSLNTLSICRSWISFRFMWMGRLALGNWFMMIAIWVGVVLGLWLEWLILSAIGRRLCLKETKPFMWGWLLMFRDKWTLSDP